MAMAISTSKLAATTSEIQEPHGKGAGGMFLIYLLYLIQSKQNDKKKPGKKKYESFKDRKSQSQNQDPGYSPLLEYYKFWFKNYFDNYLICLLVVYPLGKLRIRYPEMLDV